MTVSTYKRQAERLANHMSSVHKVRLKSASALEAIAAVHDQPDWNTLAARGAGSPETVAEPGKLSQRPMSPDTANAYLFSRHSFETPEFCDALLSQVVELSEGFPGEKRAAIDHLLSRQIANGGGFLYLSSGHAGRVDQLSWAMSHANRAGEFKVIAPQNPELSDPFSPLCVDDADGLAAITLALLPESENNPGADFYRQSANYALTVIYGALQALNEPVSLQHVLNILSHPEQTLSQLEERLLDADTALAAASSATLSLFLSQFRKKGKEGVILDVQTFKSTLGGIAGRIAMLCQGSFGRVFNPAGTASFSWKDGLRRGYGVFLDVGGFGSDNTLVRVLMTSFRCALSELRSREERKPFAIFVEGSCARQLLDSLAETARRHGVGLISTNGEHLTGKRIHASISAAGGFGRAARVSLRESETGYSAGADLHEFKGWPDVLPRHRKGGV